MFTIALRNIILSIVSFDTQKIVQKENDLLMKVSPRDFNIKKTEMNIITI
jgi:hypothetical protein